MKKKGKTVCQIIRFRGKIEAFFVSIDEFNTSTKYQYDLYKHQDGSWRFKTKGFPVHIGFTNSIASTDDGGMKSVDTTAQCPQDVDDESWIYTFKVTYSDPKLNHIERKFGHKFYNKFSIGCRITCEQTDSCWSWG